MAYEGLKLLGAMVLAPVVIYGSIALGIGLGTMIETPEDNTARIYRVKDHPAIITIYENGRRGQIFLESPENPKQDITLDKYLDSFNDNDKRIKRAEIEKIIE